MSNKTPVSRLQELCTEKGHTAPIYDEIENADLLKPFGCEVSAFEMMGMGEGKSKKEAKHTAAVDLLEQLKLIPEFAKALSDVPTVPTIANVNGDAVSTLLDKCVQNDWPLAQFNELQGYGQPHDPEYLIECRLATLVRLGVFKTKKGAKQLAAQEMLNAVANARDLTNMAVVPMDVATAQKRLCTYRELKNSDIKNHVGILLSDRHKYFQKFDDTVKQNARQVLFDLMESPREKIELLCNSLGIKYKLKPLTDTPNCNIYVFQALGEYDCVMSGEEPNLYIDICNYFQVMLNLTK